MKREHKTVIYLRRDQMKNAFYRRITHIPKNSNAHKYTATHTYIHTYVRYTLHTHTHTTRAFQPFSELMCCNQFFEHTHLLFHIIFEFKMIQWIINQMVFRVHIMLSASLSPFYFDRLSCLFYFFATSLRAYVRMDSPHFLWYLIFPSGFFLFLVLVLPE